MLMTRISILACLAAAGGLALPPASASAEPAVDTPGPGQWTLSSDGSRLTLLSNDADLTEILDGIREVTSVPVRFNDPPPSRVSGTYRNIRVEDLLDRFDVSYTLRFVRVPDGEDELIGAWVGKYEPRDGVASPFRRPAGAAGPGGGPLGEDAARALTGGAETPEAENGVIYRSAYPVTIGLDGDARDWPEDIPWQQVTGSVGGNGPTNIADASFRVASVADEDFLYLAIDVADDSKGTTNEAGTGFARDDLLRVIIDNPAYGDPRELPPEVHLSIKRHQAVQQSVVAGTELAKTQFVRSFNGSRFVIEDGDEGWFMEAAVPWEALNMTPEEFDEQALQFNVRLVDNDVDDEDPHQLVWGRNDQNGTLSVQPVR